MYSAIGITASLHVNVRILLSARCVY